MNFADSLLRLLIFPGLLFAAPAAWFLIWTERKAVARMQQRIGPPFPQPFFDFVKLLGKTIPIRRGVDGWLMKAWPMLSVAACLSALALLPVLPGSHGFSGDVILLLALIELPSIFLIAAGFTSGSLYGEIGAAREAVLGVVYNLVFLLAVMAIAVSEHTFRLDDLARVSGSPLRWLGVLAILICLPARLHVNPFSAPTAEQEIYAGPVTESVGAELALWELAHGLEWLAMTGLVVSLALPRTGLWWLDVPLFTGGCAAIVLLLSTLSAATARFTIDHSVRFYWRCGLAAAVLAVSSALLMRIRL